jgi:non-specific serine/threonine protein kinase
MHLSAVNLGALAAERGDSVGARHWLTVSLQEAQKNGGGVAPILDSFAYLAAIEGQAERALRLAGAAAGLRQYPGAALPPRMQALIRTRVEAARRMLDEETAAAAWREGQLTDLQAAVACALDVEIPARGRSAELTPRECEVAILLAHGLTNPQIADRLIISRGTVKRHIENILTRLDLTSRSQISSWATTRYHIGHRVVDA